MKYTHLFFDLDGTLINSKKGIFNSLLYSLDKLGIPENERPVDINTFIGPPLRHSFRTLFNMSEQEAETAISIYRLYYDKSGIYDFEIYSGIKEVLHELYTSGFKLSIVTSKAEIYAEKIIERMKLEGILETVSGCEMNGDRSMKSELISYTIAKLGIIPSDKILMIGDRYHDIRGAQACGISSAAILYGYGSHAELVAENPDLFISSPYQLLTVIN